VHTVVRDDDRRVVRTDDVTTDPDGRQVTVSTIGNQTTRTEVNGSGVPVFIQDLQGNYISMDALSARHK